MKSLYIKTLKAAFLTSLPVLMGYLAMGAAFGILLNRLGLSPWWAFAMCLTILSGSMQFAAVGMIANGTGLLETALMTLFINIRYCMYGLSLIGPFRECRRRRAYMIFTLTDETYALQVQDERPAGVDRGDFMFLIGLFDHIYWIAGGLIGSLAGTFITFDTSGIDFAMTALFLVILTEQCLDSSNRVPAAVGAAATLAALAAFGADNMLLPAMLIMIPALLLLRRKLDRPAHKAAGTEGAE